MAPRRPQKREGAPAVFHRRVEACAPVASKSSPGPVPEHILPRRNLGDSSPLATKRSRKDGRHVKADLILLWIL
eukprot:3128264-Pyramimonas_sp.AAC.1